VYKHICAVVLLLATSLLLPRTEAQSFILDLPRDSQHAALTQRIGITDVTVSYHRPLVKGRPIWGKLVPYGQVWRAGANENTTIAFSDSVSIEGQSLPRGTYGLHMIPGENEWTIIFSKNSTSWGSFTYNQAEDALRVKVKPQPGEMREALSYEFDDPKPDSSVLTLRWEKLAVPVKIGVNTSEIVQASLHNQLRGLAQYSWFGWDDAGAYLLTNKVGLEDALKYEDQSIQAEERFDNLLTKSQVLDAMGRKDDATAARLKALELANAIQLHGYGRQLQTQGKQDEAFQIFRTNIRKNPNHWLVHNEEARMACSKGDYDGAAKLMRLSADNAPPLFKTQMEALVRRLEAKEDINK